MPCPPLPEPERFFLAVQDREIECEWYAARVDGRATFVLLHEGLGSVAMWKWFPAQLAHSTGHGVLVYSRYGYGRSSVLEEDFDTGYMHREALEALPELLERRGLKDVVLIGHSDGASIALIHAGRHPVRGVVVMAPHVFCEDVSVRSIEAARDAFQNTALKSKLARYHTDPERSFYGWNRVWLLPAFREWNIEEYLPGIECPLLAIQGYDDEYGTLAQIEAIERQAGGPVTSLLLQGCGHSPHRDKPHTTMGAIQDFMDTLHGQ